MEGGDNILIAGLEIAGTQPVTVVLRGKGPSLTQFGVPRALPDPVLVLYSGATVIARNDNWQSAANAGQLQSMGEQPSHPNDAAILITLQPGVYTVMLYGANGTTGIGMVEAHKP